MGHSHVSLVTLRDVLLNLLGEPATDILMELIIIELDKLHENNTNIA